MYRQYPNDEVKKEASSGVCTICINCEQTCSCEGQDVNTMSESMRGGASHGVIVRPKMHTECEECIKIDTTCGKCVQTGIQYVECVQAGSSQPGASKNERQAVPVARKFCKAKFQLTNIEGGTFSLKLNSNGKRGSVKEGVAIKSLNCSESSFFSTCKRFWPWRK